MTVGLLGDIAHSRVARSNIWGLTKLGAKVILCGPPTLVPRSMERLGCEVAYRLDDVLPRCDVVNVLRIQFERQQGGLFPSVGEYSQFYMMTQERVRQAKPDLLLLAPGPINRGVELTPEVADGKHSAILDQVTNGLAVRMAVLYLLSERKDGRPRPTTLGLSRRTLIRPARLADLRRLHSWANSPCRPSRSRAGRIIDPSQRPRRDRRPLDQPGPDPAAPARATKKPRS